MIRFFFISIALVLGIMMPEIAHSQCAQVLDNDGLATSSPTWYGCSSASNVLSIETSTTWTDLLIDWGDGNGAEAIGAFQPGDAPVQHAFTADGSFTVTLAEADGSCSVVGTFHATPPVSNFWASAQSVCEGTAVQFHQEATGVQYLWNFGINSNFLSTSTGHVSFTYQNPGTYTVQSVIQIPGSGGACADTSVMQVTVLPKPIINMSLSATEGCGSLTVSGSVSAPSSYLYVWSFMPSPSFQTGTTLTPITFNNPGNHPISVAVTGVNGCQATAQQFVTVHHQPQADFAFDGACIGESTAFSDESTAHWTTDITGWYWQFGDGSISYESNPVHNYAFIGDYNVSLTVTTPECSGSTSQFVTVNPLPFVTATSDITSGCSPLDVEFSANASLASDIVWNINGTTLPGATVQSTFNSAIGQPDVHTATVHVTSAAGCVNTDDVIIQAFPQAQAQIDPVVNAGCAPFSVGIDNLSQGAQSYEWYANGNLISTSSSWNGTLQNATNAIQSQTVELVAISANGCNDSTSATLQVYPQADFTFDLPNDTACSPLELTMPYMNGVNSLSWNFGAGNTSYEQSPSIVLENTNGGLMGTSITFTGISVFGCLDSHTETVYVRPQPVAQFTADNTAGCEPMVANLQNFSTYADAYIWDFGDGISDDGLAASHAFYTSGSNVETYDITLTAIDNLGCTDTETLTVTVYPAADYTLDLGAESVCSPLEMNMPTLPGLQNFTWNFGDGTTSNEATPFHTWSASGASASTYIVTLSAETEYGCGGFAVDLIQVKPQPIAAFTADNWNGCEPLESNFTSTSSLANALAWTFGDGTTATGGTTAHTFESNGDITDVSVMLTATHALGCVDTALASVSVFPAATYELALSTDSVCSPLELTMPAIAGAQNVTWNFGDGATSNELTPTHTWNNATGELMIATVTLEAETAMGCPGTSEASLFIKPQPIANFSVNYDAGCEPLISTFTNASTLADSYDWNFGDGTTGHEVHPVHAFATDGTANVFEVTLTAIDDLGCSDVATKNISVFPTADFALVLNSDPVCSPLALTMPTIPGAQNITWNFGDGTTATGQNASHEWHNTGEDLMAVTVSFEAETENGCIGSASSTVYIKPQPQADFDADVLAGCSPLSVQFNNASTQADAFEWTFGNGTTSSAIHPAAVFNAEGTATNFQVSLTATDDLGCTSTITREITAYPAANFELALAADSACSPLELTLPTIPGAQNLTWNFGDGTSATGQNPSHAWVNSTGELISAEVTFNAETLNGCVGSASAMVHIKPQPVANFSANAVAGCEPLITTFTNNSANGDLYIWNFGDALLPGQVDNAASVIHTFEAAEQDAPSIYEVTLLAIDNLGCTDERTLTVEVNPTPEFALTLEVNEACAPLVLTMPTMEGAEMTYWAFGDGVMSNESNPTHSWSNPTNDLITRTIDFQGFNSFGCGGTASADVFIKPQPQAEFALSADAGCAPFALDITNQSTSADVFEWTYGDGQSEALEAAGTHTHIYNGEETLASYTVALTATHTLGCVDTVEKTVTVYPEVEANWTGLTSGCAPFDAAFEYTGTDVPSITWSLDGVDASIDPSWNITFDGETGTEQTHAIAVTAVSEFGCTDNAQFDITVHPVPELTLSMSAAATCSGEAWAIAHEALFADSTRIVVDGTDVWTNATADLAFTTVNPTDQALLTTVIFEAFTDFGCTASVGMEHTTHPEVIAAFETPAAACGPIEAALVNTSVNADAAFAWSFGDGTTTDVESPVHAFAANGIEDASFEVALIATSTTGCADTTFQTIVVWGVPEAQVTIASLEGCYPVDVTFLNASAGQALNEWNYGNGELGLITDSIHTKTFFNPTDDLISYTTTLTVTNEHGCAAVDTVTFDVGPYLNAQFDVVTQGCTPVEAQIINQSEGAAAYIWNFNDGTAPSNEAEPQHTFINNTGEDTTYHLELIAMSAYGCADTLAVGVDVYATPIAQFTVSPAIQTYPNTTVGINNLSSSSASAVQYWSFGDGDEVAADQPIFHTYNSWGTYNITLLVDNGFCADAHTQQVTILSPHPVASFTGGGTGCAPLTVEFENHSNHGAQFVWDFGDDIMTSEASPTHEYVRPGLYHVSLQVIGYQGQVEETIHYGAVEVFPSASAAFVNSPTQVIVPDQPVDFVNLSDIDATEFLWNFGDGNISNEENPVHFYTQPGIYTVSLTANNSFNCPTTYTLEHAVEATAGGFMNFPTAFTPNTGGSNGGYYDPAALDNDVFHPHHMGIVEYELVVFNKWGELLFRSTDPYIGWDGYFQGRIVRQDVYAWKATATFSNGYRTTQAGDVTLIK